MSSRPHIVFFLVEIDGRTIFVRRGLYIGFPGGEIHEGERIETCARRILSTVSIVTSLGTITHALGCESCVWDDRPASFDIFSVNATVLVPQRKHALTMRIRRDWRHDTFVKTFLRAPRKIISSVKSSSKKQLAA
jgi:hypothetical protein